MFKAYLFFSVLACILCEEFLNGTQSNSTQLDSGSLIPEDDEEYFQAMFNEFRQNVTTHFDKKSYFVRPVSPDDIFCNCSGGVLKCGDDFTHYIGPEYAGICRADGGMCRMTVYRDEHGTPTYEYGCVKKDELDLHHYSFKCMPRGDVEFNMCCNTSFCTRAGPLIEHTVPNKTRPVVDGLSKDPFVLSWDFVTISLLLLSLLLLMAFTCYCYKKGDGHFRKFLNNIPAGTRKFFPRLMHRIFRKRKQAPSDIGLGDEPMPLILVKVDPPPASPPPPLEPEHRYESAETIVITSFSNSTEMTSLDSSSSGIAECEPEPVYGSPLYVPAPKPQFSGPVKQRKMDSKLYSPMSSTDSDSLLTSSFCSSSSTASTSSSLSSACGAAAPSRRKPFRPHLPPIADKDEVSSSSSGKDTSNHRPAPKPQRNFMEKLRARAARHHGAQRLVENSGGSDASAVTNSTMLSMSTSTSMSRGSGGTMSANNRSLISPGAPQDTEGGTLSTLLRDLDPTNSGSGSGLPLLIQRTIALQIHLLKDIGQGRFGEVKLGIWRGEQVAVKIFASRDEMSWVREVEIYNTHWLRHANILQFIASDKKDLGHHLELWLITEYHPHGALYDYLQTNTLTPNLCVQFVRSFANGLQFLHSEIPGEHSKPAIAHRDIKSKNILVKKDLTLVIADLGLAVRYENGELNIPNNTRCGTMRYLPPEVLDENNIFRTFESFKMADMYSFGLVMWEMARRTEAESVEPYTPDQSMPYYDTVPRDPDFSDMKKAVIERGIRPPYSPHWRLNPILEELGRIMQECWRHTPLNRLTAMNVRVKMDRLIKARNLDVCF